MIGMELAGSFWHSTPQPLVLLASLNPSGSTSACRESCSATWAESRNAIYYNQSAAATPHTCSAAFIKELGQSVEHWVVLKGLVDLDNQCKPGQRLGKSHGSIRDGLPGRGGPCKCAVALAARQP